MNNDDDEKLEDVTSSSNPAMNSPVSNQGNVDTNYGISHELEEELSQDIESASSEELSDDGIDDEHDRGEELYDEELDLTYDEQTCEDDNIQYVDSCEEYNHDQDKFHREMNRTKIAFAAYRNGVLHLIQHQSYKQENKDESNADERISKLETLAKRMVETKAKAAFDAVLVANEFIDRRAAKKELSRLLTSSIEGNQTLFLELSKRCKAHQDDPTYRVLQTPIKQKCNQTIGDNRSPQFVKLKRLERHPDCIISTLPSFESYIDSKDDLNQSKEENDNSSKFSTTRWIGRLVAWRRRRKEYQRSCYERCSCLDCRMDLQRLK